MCERKGLLAVEENFGCVAECGCGTLHVTVGPVSVAVDAQALRRLHELLGAAIDKLNSAAFPARERLSWQSSHLALRKVLKIKH
jgi:hypothetical protein